MLKKPTSKSAYVSFRTHVLLKELAITMAKKRDMRSLGEYINDLLIKDLMKKKAG